MDSFLNRLRNMTKLRRLWLLTFFFVTLTVLIGYVYYRSWFSQQQLTHVIEPPPCWNQLCPDHSTREEALSTLVSLTGIVNKNIYDNYSAGENITRWWFTQQSAGSSGTIIYDQADTISYITIDLPKNAVSLELIFEQFGEPEQIFAVLGCADSQWLQVWLLYAQMGFGVEIFDSNIRKTSNIELNLEQDITGIVYYPENSYEDVLLSSDGIYSYQNINDIQEFIKPWQGIEYEVSFLNTCK